MKKIVTLLLALVMLVSVLALPALAATAEETHVCSHEIQPRYPVMNCIYCGGTAVGMRYDSEGNLIYDCLDCKRSFQK